MKNKIDIVKIKGIIGIVLIIGMTVFVRLTSDSNLTSTSDERYWEGMFILFLGGFAVWLMQDYVKRWFGQE